MNVHKTNLSIKEKKTSNGTTHAKEGSDSFELCNRLDLAIQPTQPGWKKDTYLVLRRCRRLVTAVNREQNRWGHLSVDA